MHLGSHCLPVRADTCLNGLTGHPSSGPFKGGGTLVKAPNVLHAETEAGGCTKRRYFSRARVRACCHSETGGRCLQRFLPKPGRPLDIVRTLTDGPSGGTACLLVGGGVLCGSSRGGNIGGVPPAGSKTKEPEALQTLVDLGMGWEYRRPVR
ncbi:hypothetical protein GCM10017600_68940 [Streptosporangium carneum]|uniref:Uncharacterized protein n=1 Tax=Streptosporangium carneum TaxID=47481 RepID=A0A9W6MH01_9ACTN|nr:hypothetical protein GCM10017600_68940 [Streptosporangium carneum]